MRKLCLILAVGLLWPHAGCGDHRDGDQGNSTYSVIIQAVDRDRLILAIKAVRQVTGLGLADAKRIVDEAPSVMSEGLSEPQARAMATTLERAGMKVEVKQR